MSPGEPRRHPIVTARSRLLALEPRLLFDAAALASALVPGILTPDHGLDATAPTADSEASASPSSPADAAALAAALGASVQASHAGSIAFVDGSMAGADDLIAVLSPQVEVVRLDATRDALAQISTALEGRTDISAIHLVGHGGEGVLRLGRTVLDAASIGGTYAAALADLGAQLGAGADLLLYGCDFAAGDDGRLALALLAERTGVDVAASTGATGSASAGGDWRLEATQGQIDSAALDGSAWEGLLPNNAPTAGSLANRSASDGGVVAIGTASAFSDSDPLDVLTYSASGLPGGLSIAPLTGLITGALGTHASQTNGGVYTVTVTATDLGGLSASSSFTLTVSNPAPVAVGDVAVTTEDTAVTIAVLVNDSDPDGDTPLSVQSASAANGSVALNGNGTLTYTPTADYNGSDTITYTLRDADGGTATGSVAVTVAAVADIAPDSLTVAFETGLSFNLLANDSFENGGRSVTGWSAAAHGSVSVAANGTLSYTPSAGYTGPDSFSYTVLSGGVTETATVSIIVLANTAPTAGTLSNASVADAQAVLIATAPAFADADPLDVLTYSATGLPTGLSIGPLTGLIGGIVDRHASQVGGGVYSVTVTATDPHGASASSTFTLTVSNPAPIALPDVAVVNEDASVNIGVITNDVDPDGDALTISAASAAHGSVTINGDGSITYAPDADYFGLDSITYTVSDGDGGSAVSSVAVTVLAVPDLPSIALPALAPFPEDTPIVFLDALGTGIEIGDVDGGIVRVALDVPVGTLTLPSVNGLTFEIGDGNADNAIAFTGSIADVNVALNGLVYAPPADYNGALTLTLDVGDANLPVQLTRTLPINIAPVVDIGADAVTVLRDASASFNVLANDTFENAGRSVSSYTAAAHGSVAVDAAGNASYTPQAGWTGSDSFSYTVTSNGTTETTTVTITVQTPPNTAPVAAAIANASAQDGATFTLNAAAAFSDPQGDTLTYSASGLPAGLSIDALTGAISGALDGHASQTGGGAYGIVVTATDPGGLSASSAFTLTVTNPAPAAVNDAFTVAEDGMLVGDLLSNDSDPDGDALSIDTTPVVAPSHGALTINADGTFTYTPAANYHGSDSFSYRLVDADGGTSIASVNLTISTVNDGPSAGAIANATTSDGASFNLAAAAAFVDADGDTLSYSASGLPAGLAIDPVTGLISGTVNGHASQANGGSYSVTVTASDGSLSASTTFTLTVTNVAPTAASDAFSVAEDGTLSGNLRANDSDPDGDALSIDTTPVVAPSHGALTINADGTFTYTPTANYNGSDSFSYRLIDADGGASIASVTVSVTASNDGPSATPIANANTADGAPFSLATAAAFGDADGDTLNYSAGGLPAGLAIDPATGLISGTIDGRASQLNGGNYNVTVTASDGSLSASTTFTLSVANPTPAAVNDAFTVTEDGTLSGNLRANDSDPDGDALSIDTTPVVAPSHGTLTLNADGTFTYTPTANYNGSDSFSYRLVDADGGMSIASVTVSVAAVNDGPSATPIANASAVDGASFSLATAAAFGDADGDTLSYSAGGLPAGLAIDPATGLISGTIDGRASQLDGGNYNVTVTASDGSVSASTTFTLSVANPTPAAVNDAFTLTEDGTLSGNLRVNDSDADGDALSIDTTPVTAPSHGTLTLAADGSFSYTPAANYNGSDSFSYRLIDADGGTSIASVTVSVNAVNDVPSATPIANANAADGAPFSLATAAAFSDADGDVLTYSASGLPAGLTIDAATGLITGTIDAHASQVNGGNYNVTVTASDGSSSANTGFTLLVANTLPMAANDSFTVAEDGTLSGDLRANDSDPDGDALSIDTTPVTAPSHGTLTLAADGSFSYTPAANYNGSDSFSYRLIDADGGTSTASVTVSVTAVNDAPDAGTLANRTITLGAAVSIGLAPNFSDADADPLSFSATGLPPGLTIDAATGVVTGGASSAGVYAVSITASDGQGGSVTRALQWTVTTAANQGPVAGPLGATGAADGTAFNLDIASAFADADGDPLAFSASGLPAGLSIDALTGTITGTVDGHASQLNGGNYAVVVTADDGRGGSARSSFTLSVSNPAPVAVDDALTVAEDGMLVGNLRANDSDADGDALSIDTTPVSAPSYGTLTLAADGSFSYTPSANYSGSDNFSYRLVDADGGTSIASVTVSVNAVNDGPSATPIANASAADGAPFSLATAAAFDDADGDTLSYSAGGLPAGLAIDPVTGLISGTVDGHASQLNGGNYSIIVTASDGNLSASTSFTLAVVNVAPSASNDAYSVAEDGMLSGNLRANDSDPDGDALSIDTTPVVAPSHGALTVNANGTFNYTPAADYHGSDSFSYRLVDADGGTSIASVTVSVSAINDAPTAGVLADRSSGLGAAVNVALAPAFADADGDALAYSASGLPPGLSIDAASGTVSGNASVAGTYNVSVSANDGQGGSVTRSLQWTVLPGPNQSPVASALPQAAASDGAPLSIATAAAFSDVDGDTLSFSASGLPAGLSIDPSSGVIAGTIDGHASQVGGGRYSIVVSADDGHGGRAQTTLTLDVANAAPQPAGDSFALAEDGSIAERLLTNDRDADGDALSVDTTPVLAPAHGTLVLQSDGSFAYTPDADYHGSDSFSYRVIDADGGTAVARVDLVVAAVNDAPAAAGAGPIELAAAAGATLRLDTAAAFADADGEALTFSASGLPPGLSIDPASGVISGDAPLGGRFAIDVTATDASGATATRRIDLVLQDAPPRATEADAADGLGTDIDDAPPRDSEFRAATVAQTVLHEALDQLDALDNVNQLDVARPVAQVFHRADQLPSTPSIDIDHPPIAQAFPTADARSDANWLDPLGRGLLAPHGNPAVDAAPAAPADIPTAPTLAQQLQAALSESTAIDAALRAALDAGAHRQPAHRS